MSRRSCWNTAGRCKGNSVEKIQVLQTVSQMICSGEEAQAEKLLRDKMPFEAPTNAGRNYSTAVKLSIFFRDGFVDRYSGEQLLNPGYLRALSKLFPDSFPFHTNWKMGQCHLAFWQFTPTIDHLIPVARGGADEEENWVTTNMLHNAAKSNWLIEELAWKLHPPGDRRVWCGLSEEFIRIVELNPKLKEDSYIRQWYSATVNAMKKYTIP